MAMFWLTVTDFVKGKKVKPFCKTSHFVSQITYASEYSLQTP